MQSLHGYDSFFLPMEGCVNLKRSSNNYQLKACIFQLFLDILTLRFDGGYAIIYLCSII